MNCRGHVQICAISLQRSLPGSVSQALVSGSKHLRLFCLNSQSPHRPYSLWLGSSTLPHSHLDCDNLPASLYPPSPTHVLYAIRGVVLDWLLYCFLSFVSFCLLFMELSIELRSSHMLSMSCMSSSSFLNSIFSSLKTTFRVRPKFLFDLQAFSLSGSS